MCDISKGKACTILTKHHEVTNLAIKLMFDYEHDYATQAKRTTNAIVRKADINAKI